MGSFRRDFALCRDLPWQVRVRVYGLEFRRELVVFSDVLQHVRKFGFSAGHDDGSPSLVFLGAMSTPMKSWG